MHLYFALMQHMLFITCQKIRRSATTCFYFLFVCCCNPLLQKKSHPHNKKSHINYQREKKAQSVVQYLKFGCVQYLLNCDCAILIQCTCEASALLWSRRLYLATVWRWQSFDCRCILCLFNDLVITVIKSIRIQ